MTRGNSLKFIYKVVGSDLTITTWDNVEKVEICSLREMFVIVVRVAWRGSGGDPQFNVCSSTGARRFLME